MATNYHQKVANEVEYETVTLLNLLSNHFGIKSLTF